MTEKQITMEQLEETVKRTDEQLDLMGWKMDNVEKQMVAPLDSQDVCIVNLLKSVSESWWGAGALGLPAAAAGAGGGAGAAARAEHAPAHAAAPRARQVRAPAPAHRQRGPAALAPSHSSPRPALITSKCSAICNAALSIYNPHA
ncbi:uncharacterized protein LOC123871145 isoform X1 [Maniola jurtina]|uniref:uncharacterized protein LOC123871145 isoform X1 n=1 Tax=Maniola jurtina TaxID=191418 RepID=UPI001E68A24B|nr:uncharacterized protein LOC123871145 isoform X1 [Maniola jurtina]